MRIDSFNRHTLDKYHDAATALRCQAFFRANIFHVYNIGPANVKLCGLEHHDRADIQRESFGSPVAIKQLPLTVQGNRVTAWRPKGINCFGLERGNGCRQGLRALCGRKSPPPCTSAEGPRCLYKCAWLSHESNRPSMASDDGGRGFHNPKLLSSFSCPGVGGSSLLQVPLDATAIAAGT